MTIKTSPHPNTEVSENQAARAQQKVPHPKQRTDAECKHSVFYFETEKRKHMICAACGRRRKITFQKDGYATVGKWLSPRNKPHTTTS